MSKKIVNEELLENINSCAEIIISAKEAPEVIKQNKEKLAFLMLQYLDKYKFIPGAKANGLEYIVGQIYQEALTDALKLELPKVQERKEQYHREWFVKLFKEIYNKKSHQKKNYAKKMSSGNNTKADQIRTEVKKVVKDEYHLSIKGLPAGVRILHEGALKKFFEDERFSVIPQEKIDSLVNMVTTLEYYPDGPGDGKNGKSEVSILDQLAEDAEQLEAKDADRYVLCAKIFYEKVLEGKTTAVTFNNALADAKFYLTYRLFMQNPSEAYLQRVAGETIILPHPVEKKQESSVIDEAWFKYLQECDASKKKIGNLLENYLKDGKTPASKQRKMSALETMLTSMQEAGAFK